MLLLWSSSCVKIMLLLNQFKNNNTELTESGLIFQSFPQQISFTVPCNSIL